MQVWKVVIEETTLKMYVNEGETIFGRDSSKFEFTE